MLKRSSRTPTPVVHELASNLEINTVRDFLTFIQARDVRRVQLQYISSYRSKILNDHGSQFTVYTGDGVNLQRKPQVVVKCAKLKLVDKQQALPEEQRNLANSLIREIKILTHPKLRLHPNIVQLFWYDLVEESDGKYTPALIMEKAVFGSLSDILDCHRSPMLSQSQRSLCLDVCSGILALHKAFVAHGDVKSDNVLIFPSSTGSGEYTAKLADFGSIISLVKPAQGEYPRYHGTPITNAPEVSEQARRLDAAGLVLCDNYSLGLLIFQIATGNLNESITAKTPSVLDTALEMISQANHPNEFENALIRVLTHLLAYEPSRRCHDLSIIQNLLRPIQGEYLTFEGLRIPSENDVNCEERDIPTFINSLFGDPHYLDFNLDEEMEAERDTQQLVLENLLHDTKSSTIATSGKAYFQLAIAYSMGYGTEVNTSSMLDAALKSAQKGYLPAQAVITAWYQGLGKQIPVSKDAEFDWLFEATAWGSFTASACLRRLDSNLWAEAREHFHWSGGYNQYFYPQQPPEYIGSSEFTASLDLEYYKAKGTELNTLAESAAIYGDAVLIRHLIENLGVNPSLTNRWGETLLVLCCKGGHLNILELLAESGVIASQKDSSGNVIRESPIHWLIAFDDDQIQAAATILARFCHDSEPDISWNHPSIDLPGRFPLGGPLHFAAFFDDANFLEALLKVFKIPINFTGSSESTALEFAVPRRRVLASKLLISEGALDPEASNTYVLMEIGTRLPHETLAIAGITQTQTTVLTSTCLDLVLDRRPELLNSNSSDGWTPLMGAVDYHDRETVKALIGHGCDVNAATSEENESMTALHFITRTKFHFKDDDILELLREAGADFSARTLLGGKRVLHFAARDDCPSIATKILNLDQANVINATTVPFGETALHIAAAYGSYKVARLLLEKGADTEIGHLKGTYHERDWDNLTPLAVAATKSRKQMVELLLKYGASGLARPRSKHSILHFAVTERDSTMMQMLLEIPQLATSEVVNARASNGPTALHLCAGNLGRHEHLSLLLKAGADVSVCTDTGHSALDIAYQTRDLLKGTLMRGDSTDLNNGGENIAEISDLCDAILVPNTRIKIVGVRGVSLGDSDNPGSPLEKNCMDDEVREDKVDLDISMENVQGEGGSFDLVEELRRWHVSIKRLEEYGSKRCCSDPFPRVLLSLNPSDQQSGGTLLV